MNIALFGGTFDPIHTGHLKAAETAARKFRLDQVLFIPAGNPPHKPSWELTPFHHRFAMVALACARHPRFVASSLEAPDRDGKPNYSIDTVQRALEASGAKDHLFFLIGADAFLDLPHWKDYGGLLDLVDFIVVSRPGVDSQQVRRIIPAELARQGAGPSRTDAIRLHRTTIHILRGVRVPAASSDIRRVIRGSGKLTGRVPAVVEEYILKEGLYRPMRSGPRSE